MSLSHAPVSVTASGEALTGVRAGWAIEPRNNDFRVPTLSKRAEGNISGSGMRELSGGPAWSENLCMYASLHAREPGRSHDLPPV